MAPVGNRPPGGGTIYSLGIISLFAGHVLGISVTNASTIVNSQTLGIQLCQANAGGNGGNATGSAGGSAGSGGTWVSNPAIASWTALNGSVGSIGGISIPALTPGYPATGGVPVLQIWNSATVYGSGQNWNGNVTIQSFQGVAIPILSGIVFITFYLK